MTTIMNANEVETFMKENCCTAIFNEDSLVFNKDQLAKMRAYADLIYEGICVPSPSPEEILKMKVAHLKSHLFLRGIHTTGKKADLIARLTNEKPDFEKNLRRICVQETRESVEKLIIKYGEDGYGDKPNDMCKVEYWLAHCDIDRLRDRVLDGFGISQ